MVNRMNIRQPRGSPDHDHTFAVSGMDIYTGQCSGLLDFERALYHGKARFAAQPTIEQNGKSSAEGFLRQAVQGALADARLEQGGAIGIVIISDDVTSPGGLPNKRARPLAALFACSGPVEDLQSDSAAALRWAGQALQDAQLTAVVVGWVSKARQAGAAVVLRRGVDAGSGDERAYALLDVTAHVTSRTGSLSEKIATAFERAGAHPARIGYVELVGNHSAADIEAIALVYAQPGGQLTCAVGADTDLPLIPALIKTSLLLARRFLPAVPPGVEGIDGGGSIQHPFYLLRESRTWFQPTASGARQAAVHTGDQIIILTEAVSPRLYMNQARQTVDVCLFPVVGDHREDLLSGLEALKTALTSGDPLRQAALKIFDAYQQRRDARYTVAIMGHEQSEVLREADFALKGVAGAFEKGSDWQTPLGSTFSPHPLGRQGSIAFVYPGAFNSYMGMAKDLFYLFPELHAWFGEVASDIGAVICEELIYPRSRAISDETANTALEARLNEDAIAMVKSGITLSTLYTMILRDVFQIEPGSAFGYSLGENSMMYAMGVWSDGDQASQRLAASEVFRTRLSGPQNAVRAYWGLPAANLTGPIWRNYLVMAAPERVRAAMHGESQVYLTHINTPRQVVIGGEPTACLRVIQSLQCAYLQAPFNHALHNNAIKSEFARLVALHDSPVVSIPQTRLYSAAGYKPMKIQQDEIAQNIGQMLCTSLDFPRLIEQVYADGSRIFIELGAGSNCAKWVDETLHGRPHTSIGINRRGVDDLTSIVRVLARLCTHRVKMDLSPLYFAPASSDLPMRHKIPQHSL